jgi:hypothetical protein
MVRTKVARKHPTGYQTAEDMFCHAQLIVKSSRMSVKKFFKPSLAREDGSVHGSLVSVVAHDH